jgi:Mannosyltransferase (PIG-V)
MKPTRIIIFTWLAWAIIVIVFQAWSSARIVPRWPDNALDWTTNETGRSYQQGQAYLLEPFMNDQVAWDSEYYLAIAVGGYDDPATDFVGPPGRQVTKSYAFFPFYPWVMRILAFPLRIFGLNPIATATLAGVIVSGLGTLLGMWALYDLTRDSLGEEGALRATFYLIIFPTSFFLIQVYSEGLFVGMAFASLAMLKRGNWWTAALFGICATLTRAVGVVLVLPMMLTWLRSGEWMDLDLEWRQLFHQGISWEKLSHAILMFSPLITYLIWRGSYLGQNFDFIQKNFFNRSFLNLGMSYFTWSEAFRTMLQGKIAQHTAYYATEFFGMVVGLVTCVAALKTHRELAWFSLAVFIISLGSGPAQGIHRYILGAPAIFVTLARWGANPVFDRAWTLISILLMGLLATCFALNMWVA